jgi:hypothetical protein
MKSVRFAILGALAAGLIAAGCGSDDNNDKQSFGTSVGSASTASLTKADFVTQANAICKTANQELDQAGQALGQSPTPEELDSFVTDNVTPTIQTELDAIRALGAPAGDEQTVNAILAAADSGLQSLQADPSLLTNGDPFGEANQLADDYGLTVCGTGSDDNGGNETGDDNGGSSGGGADDGTNTSAGATGDDSAGGSSSSGSGAPSTDSNNDGINDPSG